MRHIGELIAHNKTQRTTCSAFSLERKRGFRISKKDDRNNGKALKKTTSVFRSNARYARAIWGELPKMAMCSLKELTHRYGLSVSAGDLQLLNGKWYVTHCGLLGMTKCCPCSAITTAIDRTASDPSNSRWVFKATVYKSPGSKGFVGYGDADPSNVSPLVRGAEMRVAETRAVNRALRKAFGIGLCSVEELGSFPSPARPSPERRSAPPSANGNGSSNGQPRLRDRLCLLIRQHQLDPALVKRYAANYCGTETLREASRDLVESFITHLAEWAAKDREGLVCKLNSYAEREEIKP